MNYNYYSVMIMFYNQFSDNVIVFQVSE